MKALLVLLYFNEKNFAKKDRGGAYLDELRYRYILAWNRGLSKVLNVKEFNAVFQASVIYA